MNTHARRGGLVALVFGWLSLCTSNALALAIAQSNLSLINLTITPASGIVSFTGPWSADAFADADGATAFNVTFDGVTIAFASSSSMFATASGSANPAQRTSVATSAVNIPDGVEASSFATGRGSLYNTFSITGGTGAVGVTFSANLLGNLHVLTNNFGVSATTETIFALDLDGSSLLFRHDILSIGPNSTLTLPIATTLSASQSLMFDTPYFVFIQTDSESRAVNTVNKVPDSSTVSGGAVMLALIAFAFTLFRRVALVVRIPTS
jgi:hypothetical protein